MSDKAPPFFLYKKCREQWSVSAIFVHIYIMARFRVTTKHVKNSNGIRIEPGMSVEVVTAQRKISGG